MVLKVCAATPWGAETGLRGATKYSNIFTEIKVNLRGLLNYPCVGAMLLLLLYSWWVVVGVLLLLLLRTHRSKNATTVQF